MKITIQDAIKIQEKRVRLNGLIESEIRPEIIEADKLLLEAIREKGERENPAMLTIVDLRKMDGEPVWVSDLIEPDNSGYCGIYADKKSIALYGDRYCAAYIPGIENTCYSFLTYGKKWTAYRYRPKGV